MRRRRDGNALADPERRKRRSLLWLALMLVWMAVIFCFSAQPGDESSVSSNWLADRLVGMLGFWYDGLPGPERQLWYARFTLLIRKTAHMCEYAVLAILAFLWLRDRFSLSERNTALLTFLLCSVYAASDEFHQTFVPGRSGKPLDVLIDALGAVLAILPLCFCMQKRRRRTALYAKTHNEERDL